jgi:hypothetical protein
MAEAPEKRKQGLPPRRISPATRQLRQRGSGPVRDRGFGATGRGSRKKKGTLEEASPAPAGSRAQPAMHWRRLGISDSRCQTARDFWRPRWTHSRTLLRAMPASNVVAANPMLRPFQPNFLAISRVSLDHAWLGRTGAVQAIRHGRRSCFTKVKRANGAIRERYICVVFLPTLPRLSLDGLDTIDQVLKFVRFRHPTSIRFRRRMSFNKTRNVIL